MITSTSTSILTSLMVVNINGNEEKHWNNLFLSFGLGLAEDPRYCNVRNVKPPNDVDTGISEICRKLI